MADPKARIVLTAEDRTRPAFEQAKRNLAGLAAGARGIATAFGPIAVAASAVGAALAAINVKGAIDLADELGKLSQRSGVSVESLSALRFAAKLADVELSELGDALKKLNQNVAAAARGEKEQAAAFRTLGIEVKDAAGNVRSADEILGDLADRFAGYADGANKVALANAVGGRSFEALIPLLNGGRKGLAEARAELEKYGGVIGGDLAKQSEAFNDDLTRLGTAAEALKIKLAGQLIKSLSSLSAEFVKASKDGKLLHKSLAELGSFALSPASFVYKLLFGGGESAEGANTPLAQLDGEVKRLQGLLIGVQNVLSREPDNAAALKSLEQLRGKLAAVNEQAVALKSQNFTTGARRPANEGGGRVLTQAPALPNAGAASEANKAAEEALAVLRKTSEGRIKTLQDGLAAERDAYAFQERFLEQIYDQGHVALQQFYDAQDATRRTALEATRAAVAAEIAERQKLLNSPLLQGKDKASEREAVRNEIASARDRLSDAERKFDQAASDSALERQRTSTALRAELQTLQADVQALSGDSSARDLLEISRQVAAARTLLRDSGGDPAQADQLEQLLNRQRQLNQLREDLSRITRSAQVDEERYLIAADAAGASRTEVERNLGALRRKALVELAEQVRKAEELAAAADPNSPAVQFARELRLELERAERVVDPLRLRLEEFADATAGNIARSITDAIMDGDYESAGRQIARDLTRGMLEEDFTKPLQDELRKFIRGGIGGAGNAGGTVVGSILRGFGLGTTTPITDQPTPQRDALRQMEAASAALEGLGASAEQVVFGFADITPAVSKAIGAFESLPSLLGDLFSGIDFGGLFGGGGDGLLDGLGALFLHHGGIAGKDGSPTRYHTGGIAGLMPDEVPAILRRGEEVLTQRDPRHRSNGGTRSVSVNTPINIYVQGPVDAKTRGQIAAEAGRAVRAEVARGTR